VALLLSAAVTSTLHIPTDFYAMPLSEGLQRAAASAGVVGLDAALEACGFEQLVQLLGFRESFMGSAAVSDLHAGQLLDDLRRLRDADTAADAPCGGLDSMPAGPAGIARVRTLIYAARLEFRKEEASGVAAAALPPVPGTATSAEDQCKPLPAAEIDSYWEAGERTTSGYTWIQPKFRLSDTIMSKMIRANTSGELWIPPVDQSFSYKDPSSTRTVTTLLKAGGQNGGPELSLQMVQGEQLQERHDPISIVADYTDIISHRSAALIACYGSPEAAAKFSTSKRFAILEKHKLAVASKVMLSPRSVAILERALKAVTRTGVSTAAMLRIDKEVVDAIHERQSQQKDDGNLAVEYVCNQRTDLFRQATIPLALSDVSRSCQPSHVQFDSASSVGPSASAVDTGASVTSKASDRERRLQSERDRLMNENKRLKSEAPSQHSGGGNFSRARYGGSSRRLGGGDSRSTQICRDFNSPAGCERDNCKFRHACNKPDRQGKPCGDSRHSAIFHG